MIEKRYKAKTCDICKKTIAVKRGLFYRSRTGHVSLRAEIGLGQKRVHLCSECWNKFKFEAEKALERSAGNENYGNEICTREKSTV